MSNKVRKTEYSVEDCFNIWDYLLRNRSRSRCKTHQVHHAASKPALERICRSTWCTIKKGGKKKKSGKEEIIGDNFPEGQMCLICLDQSSLVEPLTSEKCRSRMVCHWAHRNSGTTLEFLLRIQPRSDHPLEIQQRVISGFSLCCPPEYEIANTRFPKTLHTGQDPRPSTMFFVFNIIKSTLL